MGNVVEFKRKTENEEVTVEEIQLEYVKKKILDTYELKEEDIMEVDEMVKVYLEHLEKGEVMVFSSSEDALSFANIVINHPEFKDISHFKVTPNISRLSMFYELEPVMKNSNKKYIFPSEDKFVPSIHYRNINEIL
ncbi:hypothetical protein INTERNEXUS_274 [Bacillus phage vB_BspM_Internexus]|nr:hypothetical protein INTERNEXUS_274 [Bacillus phage vB_BspM_Internexus]